MAEVKVNTCFERDDDWKSACSVFRFEEAAGAAEGSPVRAWKDPFPVVMVEDFISDLAFVEKLREHLMERQEDFEERNNDLFQFRQTASLLHRAVTDNDAGTGSVSKNDPVALFGRLLSEVVRPRLQAVSGIELNDNIFMSSSIYEHTDTLLCHDDDLEERRIAFIYYLTPEGWTDADGGQLDLFTCNENRTPGKVARSLLPEKNSLAFFHVSYRSFHQVREVLARNKTRLSLNGWFHGAPLRRPPPVIEALPEFVKFGDFPEKDFFEWINPTYLDPSIQAQIREGFAESSEICLSRFFAEGVFEKLSNAFSSVSLDEWESVGPANRRKYCRWAGKEDASPGGALVKKLRDFLQSEAYFLVLSQLTGLPLHPLAEDDSDGEEGGSCGDGPSGSKKSKVSEKQPKEREPKAVCCVEIRQLSRGCYTLLADKDPVADLDCLETALFFNVPKGEDEEESADGDGKENIDYGGYLSFVARNEKEEMLRVDPSPNTLAMVYRTRDTMSFTKYVNSRVDDALGRANARFQHVSGLYLQEMPGRRAESEEGSG